MDMNVIREIIVSRNLVGENVFLYEKPEKVSCQNYIIYNFKEIDGGSSIRTYQIDFRIVSKDMLKAIEIKDGLIEELDCFNRPCNITNEETVIRSIKLLNGGGIIKNEEKGEYNILVFFYVKI